MSHPSEGHVCEAVGRGAGGGVGRSGGTRKPWPVAVFAHNEGKNIVRCLASLDDAAGGRPIEVYVLANGCTDDTEAVVLGYAERHPYVHLVSIEYGDKSNAWNYYVHELAVGRGCEVHFFIDGDVQACPGALVELMSGLASRGHANGAAAMPVTGRSVAAWRERMLEDHEIAGNLYALRGSFVDRVVEGKVRLPVGFIGEDNLIAFMVCRDLDIRNPVDADRVVCCEGAGFEYPSLSWWRVGDMVEYWKKQVRYGKRGFQFQLLRLLLDECNFDAMPEDVDGVYRAAFARRELHPTGMNRLADYLAIRHIRGRYLELSGAEG